ncbi:MAG TPA: hypothetical protein VEA16_10760, partial [Vicinamibacterales bacterium]|nr:hypothetical protein [Vicinamibacterales bacterium]
MRKFTLIALVVLGATSVSAAVLPKPKKPRPAQMLQNPVGSVSEPSAPSTFALRGSARMGLWQSAPAASYRGEWSADTRNTWRGDDGEPRVQFNLRTGAGDSRWGFGVRLSELAGLPTAAFSSLANDVQFTWTREAGTFRFSGSFDAGRGSGTYTFTPEQTFISNMAAAGYRNLAT